MYIERRWGNPLPVGDNLGALLNEMIQAEGDEMVGNPGCKQTADAEGIEYLKGINASRKVIGQKPMLASE